MKSSAVMMLFLALIMTGCVGEKREEGRISPEELAQGFVHPPDSVKPWVYWYWISDNISREGITRDLEAMARVGIGEALIGNIGLDDVPFGKVRVLSEEWWQLIEHAIREGKRVGVDIGMFNCPGWSQSGGPWVKSPEAMRYLVSSEVVVEGGLKVVQKLAQPKEMFQDVKVLAYPFPEADSLSIATLHPKVTTLPATPNARLMVDGDTSSACVFTKGATARDLTIDIETAKPLTVRSLVLYPAKQPFAADVEVGRNVREKIVVHGDGPEVGVSSSRSVIPVTQAKRACTGTHDRRS